MSQWSLTFEVRKSSMGWTGSMPANSSQWSLTFEVRKSLAFVVISALVLPVAMEPDL